jgi:choline dehydrogenase-like flavoprotein
VREITVDKKGMATGVIYHDKNGVEHEQKAEVVVIACNGMGTPRLLLNSVSTAFPYGIANGSGLVGKNLMLLAMAVVQGQFDSRIDGFMGPIGCALWSKEFYETDLSRGFKRGYTMEVVRSSGPTSTALSGMMMGMLPWDNEHHAAFDKLFDKAGSIVAVGEDLPEEHNTVTLDPKVVDSNGIPAVKISYTLGENSQK